MILPPSPKRREIVLNLVPSLHECLEQKRPTAILAINDNLARESRVWLVAACYKVPGDISIVSFDNHPFASIFDLSTVDFFFARHAYSIAHFLIGDMSLHTPRHKHRIIGRPGFILRNSLDFAPGFSHGNTPDTKTGMGQPGQRKPTR